MKERVKKLRQQSLDLPPTLSIERAVLLTDFYKNTSPTTVSVPVYRALAFKHLMENKAICINEGELIVGERGPQPKATSTYPELCCHSLEDLDLLHNREKIPFIVEEDARSTYKDVIIPFWKDKSIREKLFNEMTPEWKDAYDSGIFTEFMEQRAPGHTVCDDKIYKKGFINFKEEIAESLEKLDYQDDPQAYSKSEQLKAMNICADAIIVFAQRHADKAMELAAVEKDAARKADLLKIADTCSHVPAHPPRNFWDALQTYWFVHLGVITELNTWDAFSPGRLDQHLYPFYNKDLQDEKLTEEEAEELLQCFWVKFNNQPAPPKVGVTAEESGTYTDFANISSGGLKVDGSDGVNDVSYMVLDVIDEMRLLQPSSNIQLSQRSPDRFLKKASRIIRKGWGQPSIFNADAVVAELILQGKSVEDARGGGTSGCVETGAFGKESYILTGYFNLPKILEITLNNGVDPVRRKKIGLETGSPSELTTFEDLFQAFKKQMEHFIDIKIRGNNVIERLYATFMPAPFLSIVVDDCIKKGKDYNEGGARYNTNYIQGVGIGSLSDSLAAIKYNVYDNELISLEDLMTTLEDDYVNHEGTRQRFLNKTPKYGNDDDYPDSLMARSFRTFYEAVNGRKNTKGGVYRINMLPTTCHVYFGSVTGATPDGRKAFEPLSEGISPAQGADRQGPTAVLKSASKMDHILTGGTLLNLKFTPQVLEGEEGINKLTHLVRSYFKMNTHHIQFNVVDAATLLAAQKEPEKYRDLIVRVAGYSDYFCDLSQALQNEIIARTEHQSI
jgi:formate C-acetyltransferase